MDMSFLNDEARSDKTTCMHSITAWLALTVG